MHLYNGKQIDTFSKRNYITMKMSELIYFKYTLRCNNNVQNINNLLVISIFLSQILYLFSSVKENQVDTFSLGYLHCESVEQYGIIQVLTRQLGNESMNYISILEYSLLFRQIRFREVIH
jgi:hypothetical protein